MTLLCPAQMPDDACPSPSLPKIQIPVWVDAITSVCTPIASICDSGQPPYIILVALATIIDQCEDTSIPARLAICLCDSRQQETIEAVAIRYGIPGEMVRIDRSNSLRPDDFPADHWMNSPQNYVRAKIDRRPRLATPVANWRV